MTSLAAKETEWSARRCHPAGYAGSALKWRKPLPIPDRCFHVPTVTELMVPLTERDDRSVYFEDSFTSWSDHVRQSAAIAMKLRKRL